MAEPSENTEQRISPLGTEASMREYLGNQGFPPELSDNIQAIVFAAPGLAALPQADQVALLKQLNEQIQSLINNDMELETAVAASVQNTFPNAVDTGDMEYHLITMYEEIAESESETGKDNLSTFDWNPWVDHANALKLQAAVEETIALSSATPEQILEMSQELGVNYESLMDKLSNLPEGTFKIIENVPSTHEPTADAVYTATPTTTPGFSI